MSSAAPLDRTLPSLSNAANQALVMLETEIGGRVALVERLVVLDEEKLSDSQRKLLELVVDPGNDVNTLGRLCAMAGMSVPAFLAFLSQSRGARAIISCYEQIYAAAPSVVGDVMKRARPHLSTCPRCKGKKTVVKKGGGVRRPGDDYRPDVRVDCSTCSGAGEVLTSPSLARQKYALGLVPHFQPKASGGRGPAIHITQQQQQAQAQEARNLQIADAAITKSVLGQIIHASDRVLFKRPIKEIVERVAETEVLTEGEAPLDAEVLTTSAPTTSTPAPAPVPAAPVPAAPLFRRPSSPNPGGS